MARDIMYYFDGSDFVELGEVQQGYNVSLTLDGTKDSAKYKILSYEQYDLMPYTILRHNNTNWIVSHDKVSRYQNEDGFLYEHELQLLGFIELLNARDLTDCGFRSNKYTVKQFVQRLFKLSNCEHTVRFEPSITSQNIFDLDQIVEYNKTFENYTLLSALRELFNGFNCGVKARLQQNGPTWDIYLNVIPKSGDTRYTRLDISEFDNVEAISNVDKNSYGSIVISNAENVISPKTIRFPVVGATRLKAQTNIVNGDSACIMLPTNVYKALKITIVPNRFKIAVLQRPSGSESVTSLGVYACDSNVYDEYALNQTLQDILDDVSLSTAIKNEISEHLEEIKQNARLANSFEFYDGFLYDAMNDKFKYPQNPPTGMKLHTLKNSNPSALPTERQVIFTDKATRDSLSQDNAAKKVIQGIYWERGSNLIRGFDYFEEEVVQAFTFPKAISVYNSVLGDWNLYQWSDSSNTYYVRIWSNNHNTSIVPLGYNDYYGIGLNKYFMNVFVDYIPMVDMKIKVNNGEDTQDIQLYNQTGKLTDSVALSKLINSYSREITSEEITRNMTYYSEDDLPKTGQVVNYSGTDYIINNVSYDYVMNEIGWFIFTEVTMTKVVAVKSLMVNADSNIRDYGIPQNYNVKRKEIYGNAFQVTYFATHRDTTDNNLRFSLKEALDMFSIPGQTYYSQFRYKPSKSTGYVAFIKCEADYDTYDNSSDYPIGTTSAYYYKLDCTKFTLKNQLIVMVDFQDNNIIGYDSQTIASGWSTSNFFNTQKRVINTPVSYVISGNDLDAGTLEGITIQFVNQNDVDDIYNDYADSEGFNEDVNLFNGSVFLDPSGEIYDLAYQYSDFEIVATDYNKDALEVPVFEVSYQLISSDRVIVGEDIFNNHEGENVVIMYGFKETTQYVNEHNALSLIDNELLASDGQFELENACEVRLQWSDGNFYIYPYTSIRYDSNEQQVYKTGTPTYVETDFSLDEVLQDETYFDSVPNGIYQARCDEFFEDISDVPEIYGLTLHVYIYDDNHNQMLDIVGNIDYDDPSDWYIDVNGRLIFTATWQIDDFDYSQWDISSLRAYVDSYEFRIRGEDTNIRFNSGKNIIVFRYICGKVSQEVEKTELVFVAKNVPSVSIQPSGQLLLQTNIYKLK